MYCFLLSAGTIALHGFLVTLHRCDDEVQFQNLNGMASISHKAQIWVVFRRDLFTVQVFNLIGS